MLGLCNLFLTAILLIIGGLFTFGIIPFVYFLYMFWGRLARIEKAKTKFKSNLMKDEEIVALCIQGRALSTLKRRTLVGITNSRVIILHRNILGGYKTLRKEGGERHTHLCSCSHEAFPLNKLDSRCPKFLCMVE